MKRDYSSGVSESADLFTGVEVEHTPAHGMMTLFVVGIKSIARIWEICSERKINHVYLGANHSFNGEDQESWEKLAIGLLNLGYWVTLDLDVKHYEASLDTLAALSERDRFIAQISVKLPYLTNLNYHATVKIDDRDFRSTNPGVWVHTVHSLMKKRKFTDWSQYGKDEIIPNIVRVEQEQDDLLSAPFVPLSSMMNKDMKREKF
jgi:hypothetical protein